MPLAVTLGLTFVAFVAMNAARVVLTLYALTLGAPASSVGVLGGMFYIFPLLLSCPIGAAADRIGPRRLLVMGALCGTGSMLLPYFVPELRAFMPADPGIWRMLTASAMVQLGTDIFQFYIPIYGHAINMSASAWAAARRSP